MKLITRRTGHHALVALVGLGCAVLSARPAAAQSDLEQSGETPSSEGAADPAAPSDEPDAPEASAEASGGVSLGTSTPASASAEAKAEPTIPAQTKTAGSGEREMRDLRELELKNGFVAPRPAHELEWHGGLNLDIANAKYTFSEDAIPEETLYDFRGRFVVGPTVMHEMGDDYFVAARAELVGWVRERENVYQVNVDDVYGRFGKKGVWDVTAGRFNAWRVYHRGRGFDLFTVEDLGACTLGNCGTQNPQNFGVSMYEVDNIYMRGPYGRAAVHIYPTEWSGIQLLGEYGSTDTVNALGGRAAATAGNKYFRASAAGEYRTLEPTTVIAPIDANGNPVPCPKCGTSSSYGFGGGVELTIEMVEVGASGAYGAQESFAILNGSPNLDGSGSVVTYGGYGELDIGWFWGGSFIVGGGAHWTQQNLDNNNYDSHLQMAAFAAYPLGFNASEVKLVVSRAQLERLNGGTQLESSSESNAVRLRFSYPF